MKNLPGKSIKYVFSIIPLTAIILLVNLKRSPDIYPVSNAQSAVKTDIPLNSFFDLPCGFVSKGKVAPQKPMLVTNNDIPVLMFPAGTYMQTGKMVPEALDSDHATTELVLQEDGNLVLYCKNCTPMKAMWSTQTNGKGGRTLFFQSDGELVLHNANGKIIWRSNIRSKCPGSENVYFNLQDDGNLVMQYNESPPPNQSKPANMSSAPPSPGSVRASVPEPKGVAYSLGSTGTINGQGTSAHQGRFE